MPYIKHEERVRVLVDGSLSPGELNYLITHVCQEYLYTAGVTYTNINTVIGALECAKQEFYRRVAVPYEDQKIKENGDVY